MQLKSLIFWQLEQELKIKIKIDWSGIDNKYLEISQEPINLLTSKLTSLLLLVTTATSADQTN